MNRNRAPRAGSRRSAGAILLYATFILLFVFPVLLVLTKRAITQNNLNVKDWQAKSARGLTLNVPFDYVRQFSQRPFIDYGNVAQFNRPELFYSVGFTTVTFQLNAADHSVYLRALGKYGSDPNNPKSVKTLESVIKFSSDLLLYGQAFGDTAMEFTGVGGGTIQGGYYCRGLKIVPARNPTFNGGPIVINGEVDIQGAATFNGDVYFADATPNWGPATYNGVRYPYAFNVTMPPNTPNYYLTYNTLNTGHPVNPSSQTWQFGYDITALPANRTFFTIAEEAGNPRHVYPEAGAILVAENTALTLRGPVHGRVTVVVTGNGTPIGPISRIFEPATGAPVGIPYRNENVRVTGNAIIESDFRYCHVAGLSGDINHAFAIMASSNVVFHDTATNNPLRFTGVIYSWHPGPFGGYLSDVRGTAGLGALIISGLNTAGSVTLTYTDEPQFFYDPSLAQFPPPGLPETPRVVSLKPSY